MQCLHGLPAGTKETLNRSLWFCNQKPTCNFICSEDEKYLYEMGIIAFEKTKQPQPECCKNNLARLRMVKDITKQNYGRPFFVCSKDTNRCLYFEWADEFIPPKPYCFHNQTARECTVKKEGPNKGKTFFRCRRSDNTGECGFFQWGIVEEGNQHPIPKDIAENPHTISENMVKNPHPMDYAAEDPPPTQKGSRKRESSEKRQTEPAKKRQPLLFYTKHTL